MNKILPQRLSWLLGLTMFAVMSSGLSAQAQTTDKSSTNDTAKRLNNSTTVPVPGTTATSVAAFTQADSPTWQQAQLDAETDASKVAQSSIEDVQPGRATIGGLSYIGVGGSFGTNNAFAVVSKIGLTNDLSVRPSATFEDDEAYFRIPLTYEFLPIPPGANFTGFASISPYIGGGLTLNVDGELSALATAGIDVPLGPRFTGTANVNLDFLDDTQVAVVVGFGYNFAGF